MTPGCRVCGAASGDPAFSGVLLGQTVAYFDCSYCGYVQTQDPSWLDRAYAAPINGSDTGIMQRNFGNVGIVLATLTTIGRLRGRVVDAAGGYGILVRLLRDQGVDALWADRYCNNALAGGFEYTGGKADLVTAFEAFEHFVKPADELERLFAIAPNVLLSTEIIASPAPPQADWWYYGKDHGQHIGFIRTSTLEYLAHRFEKHLLTDAHNYHLFTEAPVSQWSWRIYRRIARFSPRLLARDLTSKVWSDYEYMSNR